MFEDETGFTLHPRLGMGWAKRGKRLRIPTTSQHRTRLNVFGWVAPLLGRKDLMNHAQGNREGFLLCLRHLYLKLRGYKIWLYADKARWHQGDEVAAFLQTHKRLHLEYLPCYQPGLNLQERIWRQIRYEATTNQWFASLEEIWVKVQKTAHAWTPGKTKHLCKVY